MVNSVGYFGESIFSESDMYAFHRESANNVSAIFFEQNCSDSNLLLLLYKINQSPIEFMI